MIRARLAGTVDTPAVNRSSQLPSPLLRQCSLPQPRALVLARGYSVNARTELSELLSEHGFLPYQAERLMMELDRKGADQLDRAWVQERLAALARVLGTDFPPPSMVYNGGLELLEKDTEIMPAQLVIIKEVLPGADILSILSSEPKLLWLPDVGPQLQAVMTKLQEIYPYEDGDICQVVQEYPELLIRLQYYSSNPKIRAVEDLPVDLQNRILRSYC